MGFEFSCAPEPQSVIPIIRYLSISGSPNTRIAKQFWIFTESIMLDNLQWIAEENRYQLLDFPDSDPARYISNHPGIEKLCKRYPVDVSYHKTPLRYSRLIRRIQPGLPLLSNEIHAHLTSALLSRLMVSDLAPHAYSIQWPISTSHHSLLTYDHTPDMPSNRVCPLHITLEWSILLHSKHIFSVPECVEYGAASTHRVSIFQTLNI